MWLDAELALLFRDDSKELFLEEECACLCFPNSSLNPGALFQFPRMPLGKGFLAGSSRKDGFVVVVRSSGHRGKR